MANPEHVKLVLEGAEAICEWKSRHPGEQLDLSGADLSGVHLSEADLSRDNLVEANLGGANLSRADLRSANLSGAKLGGANLNQAGLGKANLNKANLEHADISGASFYHTRNVGRALSLETTQVVHDNDAQNFDRCVRPWPERYFDWEHLRTIGRLPLFAASYSALILIPIVFYSFAFYNHKIALVRLWAAQVTATPDHAMHQIAAFILTKLHPQPIPSLSFMLLLSTVLLAVASTLYTLFCPSRIKEFSRDQWCDQLGQSLVHYWPLTWKYRWIRLVCVACYTLGGVAALWVIDTKVWNTARFILKNSVFP